MKNALSYYYNLNPKNIHQLDKKYKFELNNENFVLLEIDKEISNIQDIYTISNELINRGIYTHQIILNNQNNIITVINNNTYVLLKIYIKENRKVQLNDIIYFSNITSNIVLNNHLKRDNWYNLWMNKIDYFEYQVNQLGKKYPLITESFSFFVGIVETGIQLLINENIRPNSLCISHSRIKKNDTLFELYNPFNFIIDIKGRDIAEYFKEIFVYDDPYPIIVNYLENSNLSNEDLKYFYIRMFYPSFYFDLYEEIILGKKEEIELQRIIDKANDYVILLKKIYMYISNFVKLPDIEWIKKM